MADPFRESYDAMSDALSYASNAYRDELLPRFDKYLDVIVFVGTPDHKKAVIELRKAYATTNSKFSDAREAVTKFLFVLNKQNPNSPGHKEDIKTVETFMKVLDERQEDLDDVAFHLNAFKNWY